VANADRRILPNWDADDSVVATRSCVIATPLYDMVLQSLIPKRTEACADIDRLGAAHSPRTCQGLSDIATVAIGVQVSEGLLHLFGNGIAHRDLKPDNVFLRRYPSSALNSPSTEVTNEREMERLIDKARDACIIAGRAGNVDVVVADVGERAVLPRNDAGIFDHRMPFTVDTVQRGGASCYLAPEILQTKAGRGRFLDYSKQDAWALGHLLYAMKVGSDPGMLRMLGSSDRNHQK
jgi:serine/threonine protein kinase